MNIIWLFVIMACFIIPQGSCQFSGDSCVEAHNILRRQHSGTNELVKDSDLERYAKEYAVKLSGGGERTKLIHPTRAMPLRRKRRSIEDGIDESVHLEKWDGCIEYPSSRDTSWLDDINRNRQQKIGRSIHEICCTTEPHCPKEFFHGLSFPPTADGIVNDMYNEEEKYYDYSSGKSKTIYSHIDHFAKIVWKNTTLVGCGQSISTRTGCAYTVVLYHGEGAVGGPQVYINNIGLRDVTAIKSYAKVTQIILIVFIIGILIALVVLLYCCRHKINERYKKTMITIDVLKAEQELETDSTSGWWLRPCKARKADKKAPLPEYQYIQQPSEVVTPTRPPVPNRPSLKNIPRAPMMPAATRNQTDVNQIVSRYRGMSLSRQGYEQLRRPTANERTGKTPAPVAPSRPAVPARGSQHGNYGKSTAPPPIPRHGIDNKMAKPATTSMDAPGDKPRPVPRKLPVAPVSSSSGGVEKDQSGSSGKKPMLPPAKPKPKKEGPPKVTRFAPAVSQPSDEEDKPVSVLEMKKLLEKK